MIESWFRLADFGVVGVLDIVKGICMGMGTGMGMGMGVGNCTDRYPWMGLMLSGPRLGYGPQKVESIEEGGIPLLHQPTHS